MSSSFSTQHCLLFFVIAIIVVVCFFWLVYPSFNTSNERFNNYLISENEKAQENSEHPEYPVHPEYPEYVEHPEVEYPEREHEEKCPKGEEYVKYGKKRFPYGSPNSVVDPTKLAFDGPGCFNGLMPGANENLDSEPSEYKTIDDPNRAEMGLSYNRCSKACCGVQYPPPFQLENDKNICQNKDQYVNNNYFCSNSFDSTGCMCITKDQADFLYNRGGNGRGLE